MVCTFFLKEKKNVAVLEIASIEGVLPLSCTLHHFPVFFLLSTPDTHRAHLHDMFSLGFSFCLWSQRLTQFFLPFFLLFFRTVERLATTLDY